MGSLLKSHASATEVALSQDHKPNDAVERESGGPNFLLATILWKYRGVNVRLAQKCRR